METKLIADTVINNQDRAAAGRLPFFESLPKSPASLLFKTAFLALLLPSRGAVAQPVNRKQGKARAGAPRAVSQMNRTNLQEDGEPRSRGEASSGLLIRDADGRRAAQFLAVSTTLLFCIIVALQAIAWGS